MLDSFGGRYESMIITILFFDFNIMKPNGQYII